MVLELRSGKSRMPYFERAIFMIKAPTARRHIGVAVRMLNRFFLMYSMWTPSNASPGHKQAARDCSRSHSTGRLT
jgi:hypothetical protein